MSLFRIIAIISCLLLMAFPGLHSQNSPTSFIPLMQIDTGLSNPLRLAIDKYDNIYVTDAFTKCIRKYDSNGNLLMTLAEGMTPISVAAGPDGKIFFGDEATGDIYRLNQAGQPEVFFSGTVFPTSLVVSPDNILYAADDELKLVLVLDPNGTVLDSIGAGMLSFPTGLAFDKKNNHILVSEHGGLGGDVPGCSGGMFGSGPLVKVNIFDRQGNSLGSFGCFGNSGGKFYRTQGISSGRCGNIYVCEPFQGKINVYSNNGTFITQFGEFGSDPGQLNLPMDIAFDSQDRIIISCYNKGSLELFTIDDPLPSATMDETDIAVCEGMRADIPINFTGTPPWNFTYTYNGVNPVTVSNIASTPYILTVTQPGDYLITAISDSLGSGTCITGAAHVSHHPRPTSAINCGDQVICSGTFAEIPIHFTGDGPWTFTYTLSGMNPATVTTYSNPYTLKADQPGRYTIIALSGRNCEGSIFNGSVLVTVMPQPSATFTDGNNIIERCVNSPPTILRVVLNGTPPWTFTYTIDNSNPVTVQTYENPFVIATTQPGTYRIQGISDNFCSSTDTSGHPSIIVLAMPTVQFTATQIGLCPFGQNYIPVKLTGTPPWAFTITRNGLNPAYIFTWNDLYFYPVSKPGFYQVTYLEDGNCTGNPAGVGVNVIKANVPSAYMPVTPIPLCEGQTVPLPINFKGVPPFTFTYLHNGTNPVTLFSSGYTYLLAVSEPGTYKLTSVMDSYCSAIRLPPPATVVQYGSPVANFIYKANQLEVSFSNRSVNASQYMWYFGDNDSSNAVNPVHMYAAPGNYTVTLNASSSYCGSHSYSQTITLAGMKNSEISGIPAENEDAEMMVNIYPNPGEGLFTVEIKGACNSDINLEVMNMTGNIILSLKNMAGHDPDLPEEMTQKIDLRSFASGAYLVRVQCGNVVVRRLIMVAR